MSTPPRLTNIQARRLFLDRHFLLSPSGGPGRGADLDTVLHGLGFVQVDSVNTLARAHDLILWSRRQQYRPKALMDLVAQHRTAFEHWTHDAAILPMSSYPLWRLKFERDRARMDKRWQSWRRDGWRGELDTVLRQVEAHGPTCSKDVGVGEARSSSGWWDWHPSKTALEYLWRAGELSICHRKGFRKFYDLSERVIPEEARHSYLPDDQIIDQLMRGAMDRLGLATPGELAAFHDVVTPAEAKQWCVETLTEGLLIEVEVEQADGSIRRALTTESLLQSVSHLPDPSARVRLLSPFDPALRDRKRAERLLGFSFRIEIFVPAAQRKYGYYVFPVMQGDGLIGRIDAKRAGDILQIDAFWPEHKVRLGKGRLAALHAELERIARFAGLSDIVYQADWIKETLEQ